ncbi:phosphoribosylformylglycinamidine synthase subunit PurS [Limisalsivibrio acetivorans]|uniref:phosphoribosylformylglycinamidine synthase subunit PurS n=1 Tax=Limisalsivibrio acetivorans TaxID=1304888 RepID=UPI0003B3530C|nr:phosphoribosylformylglycinamidine synthase subunit PurS [Limisalsivibrio acetivorans]
MKVKVYVKLKSGVLDPQGQTILGSVRRLGHDFVKDVRVGKFFEIEVDETENLEEKIAEISDKVLSNPIIEEFSIETDGDR